MTGFPTPLAVPRKMRLDLRSPIVNALTRQLPLKEESNAISPATVGTPMQLPYPAMPATTPSSSRAVFGCEGWPKRSAFIEAMGRAPMVNTSRRMPPTPVAAPWYGSMNDGWLCDSILNTTASPSPMSTTPAFSPGPWITRAPLVGNFRKCTRDDLYEQCSLHITEKIPS